MKKTKITMIALSCLLILGCATQQVDFKPNLPKNSDKLDAEPVYDKWHGFVLLASKNLKGPIDVEEHCSLENLVRIENEITVPQALLGAIPIVPIFYVAQQSRIYCNR